MSNRSQFNTKSPTIKRILKEASELASNPSADLHAEPLEDNLFEWHFTIKGPPSPSPYAGGIYHGRIVLPPQYPLRPPSFRFLTPTGRFEVNREICLSISGHHEETWQPAWGIRTAMVAIRSFMDSDVKGQVGGIECSRDVRRDLAGKSTGFRCAACGRSNAEIMREREEMVREMGGEEGEETVPEELRLKYRDELGKEGGEEGAQGEKADEGVTVKGKEKEKVLESAPLQAQSQVQHASSALTSSSSGPDTSTPIPRPRATRTIPGNTTPNAPAPLPVRVQPVVLNQADATLDWVDACIYGVVAALLFFVARRFL